MSGNMLVQASKFRLVFALALILCPLSVVSAQTIAGSIVGTVRDATGYAVPGTSVTLTHLQTGARRTTLSNERGDFVFANVPPGEYNLVVEQPGFKRYEKRNINLPASETLSVGIVTLEIGEMMESVEVTAEGGIVKTKSAERSDLITSTQIQGLTIRSRNVMTLVGLLPGVQQEGTGDFLNRRAGFNANGNRFASNNVTVNGVSVTEIGDGNQVAAVPSMDAVAEIKVLLSNYQAEYGSKAGATVQLVTKSGTRDFHGVASYFKRHEQFDANNFFNNRFGRPKGRSRFNTWTYGIGGPIYIPGKFNQGKDKLFFFWNQEFWPVKRTEAVRQLTFPTNLEREGDFSQTLGLDGKLVRVVDPLTGRPFLNNQIPASRIDSNGQALLKRFPEPNFFDRSISGGGYNFVFQNPREDNQRTDVLKIDYHIDDNNLLAVTYTRYDEEQVNNLFWTTPANWPMMPLPVLIKPFTLAGNYTRIFSPNVVNELNVAYVIRPSQMERDETIINSNRRDLVGFTTGQFSPEANPFNIIPNAFFGGISRGGTLGVEGRFFLDERTVYPSVFDNLSFVRGNHTIKVGFFAQFNRTNNAGPVPFNGEIRFDRNPNNPLDTGYAYSNALLGVFSSYREATAKPEAAFRLNTWEFFAQDAWRVTPKLTLDYGMRFYHMVPIFEASGNVSGFDPTRFDSARAVQLVRPALSGGKRVGRDPITGKILPSAFIGSIVPGSGDPANGLVVPARDSVVPKGLVNGRGLHFGPRVGFAYDIFGNGKTAIRAGAGVFYERQGNLVETLFWLARQTPLAETPTIFNGSLDSLLSSPGVLFPQAVIGLDPNGKTPSVTNFSLSVQQDIGAGTVVDIGYVGSLGRHLMWQRNLNAIPLGANFDPANADPAAKGSPLPPDFLRPFPGFNDLNFREPAASSNYHSLQVTVNRRFAKRLNFGGSWTWSRSLDFADSGTAEVSTLVPVRAWNYGLSAFDRTHMVRINWLYELPGTPFTNSLATAIFNDWQISGIASFISGSPWGIGVTTTRAFDITGSPTHGARAVVTGDPNLPKGERTFDRNFRTEVFQFPAQGTVGNAAKTVIRGPGINNWDIALFKDFPIMEGRARIQFRWEMYNAFNHTQFAGLDTSARFNPATGEQVNSRFGEFTSARDPRQMQFALRLEF